MPVNTDLTPDLYIHLLEFAPKLRGQLQLQSTIKNKYSNML